QLDEAPPAPEPVAPRRPTAVEPPAPAAARPQPAANGWRPPAMVLLADSGPVQPPAEAPEPDWAINLNPRDGSSVLGPRSPAAVVERVVAAPAAWRAQTVAYVQ